VGLHREKRSPRGSGGEESSQVATYYREEDEEPRSGSLAYIMGLFLGLEEKTDWVRPVASRPGTVLYIESGRPGP
jgi:hypothetical protein